jgi:hypothetical protein
MFSLAVEDGHISFNPATRILKRSRTEEGERKEKVQFLTREEVGVLLETCKEHFPSYFPLILLLVRTGLLIQNRESLASVKEQLGHHSIQITVDRLDEPGNATIRNPDATTANNPVLSVPLSARK